VLSLIYNDASSVSGIGVGGREGFKSLDTLSPVFCWQCSPICGMLWYRTWQLLPRTWLTSVADQWMTTSKCTCPFLGQGWVYSCLLIEMEETRTKIRVSPLSRTLKIEIHIYIYKAVLAVFLYGCEL